jgi:hypothetical protein
LQFVGSLQSCDLFLLRNHAAIAGLRELALVLDPHATVLGALAIEFEVDVCPRLPPSPTARKLGA